MTAKGDTPPKTFDYRDEVIGECGCRNTAALLALLDLLATRGV